MPEHILSKKTGAGVLVALLLLTAATWLISFADLGHGNAAVALGIAAVKATLVVLFFMHVLYSSRLTKLIIVSGIFFLAVLLAFTMTDYLSRPWEAM